MFNDNPMWRRKTFYSIFRFSYEGVKITIVSPSTASALWTSSAHQPTFVCSVKCLCYLHIVGQSCESLFCASFSECKLIPTICMIYLSILSMLPAMVTQHMCLLLQTQLRVPYNHTSYNFTLSHSPNLES